MPYYLSITVICLYISLNIYVQKKIDNGSYLKEERKELHKILIWLVPFLGPLMIKHFWDSRCKINTDVITKKDRKTTSGSFHESGIGVDV